MADHLSFRTSINRIALQEHQELNPEPISCVGVESERGGFFSRPFASLASIYSNSAH
jgi:hypothetical protein